MRVSPALLCAVLLGSVALYGQQPAPASPDHQDRPWLNQPPKFKMDTQSGAIFVLPPASQCPVGMHARHAHDGEMVRVRHNEQASAGRHGQGIHLILDASKMGRHVSRATVTARGYSQRGRILDAKAGDDAPDMSRTLDVQFSPEGEGAMGAEFFLPGFSSVTTVRLDNLTYDDGSTWKPENASMCRVAPDGFMLVAAD